MPVSEFPETGTSQKRATPGAAARLILRFPFSTDLQHSNRGDQSPSHLISSVAVQYPFVRCVVLCCVMLCCGCKPDKVAAWLVPHQPQA
jgi:hypothetical protein